jgi:hypothetical protein
MMKIILTIDLIILELIMGPVKDGVQLLTMENNGSRSALEIQN